MNYVLNVCSRMITLGSLFARSQTFWSFAIAIVFGGVGLLAYTVLLDEGAIQPTVVARLESSEPLTGESEEIYPSHLIAMIDRMDADIDEEIKKEAHQELGEKIKKNEKNKGNEKSKLTEAKAVNEKALELTAKNEVFGLQALSFPFKVGAEKPLPVEVGIETNPLSRRFSKDGEGGGNILRPDPFSPLIFDDGTGNVQMVGNSQDPIETDPTKDIQFMGVIGDADGVGDDTVAILRVTEGATLGTLVMRAGDSFELKGEKAILEKVEKERVLVKLANESHYVDLAAFVDTVSTTVNDGSNEGPPSEGGPQGAPNSEPFDEVEEL